MRIAYFNCSSGIAGDMILASLIDAGLSAGRLEDLLQKGLKLRGWSLKIKIIPSLYHIPVKQVEVRGEKHFGSPKEMLSLVKKSGFSPKVRELSLKIIDSLISAEAKAHKITTNKVHFHELNSIDTIIDVTGVALAIELLGIDEVYCSAINIGKPAPAALEIIKEKKVPVYSNNHNIELATPTGMAIISNICKEFGNMPLMKIENSGMGAGMQKTNANYLAVSIGDGKNKKISYASDEVVLLETNIDDMDPRIYPYLIEKLLSAGARDTWLQQILMKKGRPGITLSVMCAKEKERDIVDIVFNETTTLGIRRQENKRYVLDRKQMEDKKVAYLKDGKIKLKSEFEVVKRKSIHKNIPLKDLIL